MPSRGSSRPRAGRGPPADRPPRVGGPPRRLGDRHPAARPNPGGRLLAGAVDDRPPPRRARTRRGDRRPADRRSPRAGPPGRAGAAPGVRRGDRRPERQPVRDRVADDGRTRTRPAWATAWASSSMAAPSNVGVESTIVDLSGIATPGPAILRPGGLPREVLEAIAGEPIPVREGGEVRAPGMLASHYAPDARLLLVAPAEQAARAASLRAEGRRVGVLAFEPGSAMADATIVDLGSTRGGGRAPPLRRDPRARRDVRRHPRLAARGARPRARDRGPAPAGRIGRSVGLPLSRSGAAAPRRACPRSAPSRRSCGP